MYQQFAHGGRSSETSFRARMRWLVLSVWTSSKSQRSFLVTMSTAKIASEVWLHAVSIQPSPSCPECRALTQLPNNDVNNFPAAFRINRLIEVFLFTIGGHSGRSRLNSTVCNQPVDSCLPYMSIARSVAVLPHLVGQFMWLVDTMAKTTSIQLSAIISNWINGFHVHPWIEKDQHWV